MTVTYQGQELPLQQAAKFLDETDRRVRQDVWELVVRRRLQDHDAIEDLYNKLIDLRSGIAAHPGRASGRAPPRGRSKPRMSSSRAARRSSGGSIRAWVTSSSSCGRRSSSTWSPARARPPAGIKAHSTSGGGRSSSRTGS